MLKYDEGYSKILEIYSFLAIEIRLHFLKSVQTKSEVMGDVCDPWLCIEEITRQFHNLLLMIYTSSRDFVTCSENEMKARQYWCII